MKIYARKIDKQCITHQIAYTKEILKDFLGGLSNNDVIICEGKTTHQRYEVTILTATDDRFNSNMQTLLDAEGTMEVGDLMVMYKRARKEYIVELVKPNDEKYQPLISMFAENDRHLLLTSDDMEELERDDVYAHNVFGINMTKKNDALTNERTYVCIGWADMGDLSDIQNYDDLSNNYDNTYPNSNRISRGNELGDIWRFLKINIGDYVVYSSNGVCNIGKVTSDYYYEANESDRRWVGYKSLKNVSWLKAIDKRELSNDFSKKTIGRGHTVWSLNDYKSVIADLLHDTYQKDDEDENNSSILISTDEISEEGFREWLAHKKIRTGENLSDGYQYAYYYLLKSFPSMFGVDDVFSIHDLDTFEAYVENLKNGNTKQAFEEAKHIGAGSVKSAISNYREYLTDQASNVLSEEELVKVLKDWINRTPVSNKTSTLIGFGFKYAHSLEVRAIDSGDLLIKAGEKTKSNQPYIDHGRDLYNAVKDNSIGITLIENKELSATNGLKLITGFSCNKERNRILFGAPGTGKSHNLDGDRDDFVQNGGEYERVTFHPDYTYAQFVGSYKPQMKDNGDIEYKYTPGPFMRTLVKAYKSGLSSNPHGVLLIIEEINRANMAAVFGDTFQLLDRDKDGVSEYAICVSEDMKGYLHQELGFSVDEIQLPDNFYIWATMNSADQGVFPMDTAFKRRWNFEYIGIDEGEDKLKDEKGNEYVYDINGETIVWNKLRKAINIWMASEGINEDKQLGPFFISKNHLDSINEKENKNELFMNAFKDKVLMYLFEDACRSRRERLFSDETDKKRYSVICDDFEKKGIKIFNDVIVKKYYDLKPKSGDVIE